MILFIGGYNVLSYDDWFNKYEDEINIELAENGADREMDFDSEREFRDRYDKYVNTLTGAHTCGFINWEGLDRGKKKYLSFVEWCDSESPSDNTKTLIDEEIVEWFEYLFSMSVK